MINDYNNNNSNDTNTNTTTTTTTTTTNNNNNDNNSNDNNNESEERSSQSIFQFKQLERRSLHSHLQPQFKNELFHILHMITIMIITIKYSLLAGSK